VKSPVAFSTNCYEIVFLVVSEATSGLNVMDLKILHATAVLTSPGITIQNGLPEFLV
jgi:hypothetical protein